jgi:DNA-directed RNA polymerase
MLLRDTLVEQYQRDILGDFARELHEQLPEEVAAELPPVPRAGTLDLSEVRASVYAFA